MLKWILCALVALSGCAGAYGRAKTTPDIVGTSTVIEKTTEMTVDAKGDTATVIKIVESQKSAPAVDEGLKHHELDVKRDVGVARAEQPKIVSPFWGGNYGYSGYGYSSWGGFWGGRRIDSPRISRWGRNINPPPDMAPRVRRRP